MGFWTFGLGFATRIFYKDVSIEVPVCSYLPVLSIISGGNNISAAYRVQKGDKTFLTHFRTLLLPLVPKVAPRPLPHVRARSRSTACVISMLLLFHLTWAQFQQKFALSLIAAALQGQRNEIEDGNFKPLCLGLVRQLRMLVRTNFATRGVVEGL